jgi:hypothetical protein
MPQVTIDTMVGSRRRACCAKIHPLIDNFLYALGDIAIPHSTDTTSTPQCLLSKSSPHGSARTTLSTK